MNKILVVVAVLSVITGCEKNEDVHPGGCSVPATVRDLTGLDGCGYVFELNDGTRLEPIRMGYCGTPPVVPAPEDPLMNFEFVDGKKVMIDYEVDSTMGSYCMVGPMVWIRCITEVATNEEPAR